MRKSRVVLSFSLILAVFFLLILMSPILSVCCVEVRFLSSVKNENSLNLSSNNIITIDEEKIKNNAVNLVKQDYGQSIFLVNKEKYIKNFEFSNPSVKVVKIETVFPNKVVFSIEKRQPVFYIEENKNKALVLDSEYKIIAQGSNNNVQNLIKISTKKKSSNLTFFDFFEISEQAFSEGVFLSESNCVIKCLSNFSNIVNVKIGSNYLINNISNLVISEEKENYINVYLSTDGELGAKLEIENIFNKFQEKLKKIVKAFGTLYQKEKIKTTYGTLKINNSLNCSWNKL